VANLEELDEEMKRRGKKAVWRRSCAMFPESCEACIKAAGTRISGPEEDLSKIHIGPPSGCTCLPYVDMME
jgi:hypothetical protein